MEINHRGGEAKVSEKPARTKKGPGRPDDHRLTDDLDIICAFTRRGAVSSQKDLAEALSVDKDRIREALRNLTELSDDECGPIFSVEDVFPGRKRHLGQDTILPTGRRLRLTSEQADALCEALDRLGISRDDEQRTQLESAVFPTDYRRPEERWERTTTDAELATLRACATSIVRATAISNRKNEVRQPVITFSYVGKNDEKASERIKERHVIPLSLRLLNGVWQVDAFDLDNRRAQTFVARSMTNTTLSDKTGDAIISSIDDDESNRVNITCADMETVHKLLALNEARLEEGKDRLVVSIPYYRKEGKKSPGSWLPRHLIPLMGSIEFDNDELREGINEVVAKDLKYARSRGCI